jgi:uncharacterized membrane protein YozB (DUF420 family)
MGNFLDSPGFLGTTATFRSDASLILILIAAVLFTIGWQLAVHKRYDSHRWVQTTAVSLNAIIVLSAMIRPFVIYILPGIPAKLLEGSYGITTVHALVGMAAALFGVFVVLRGNQLVPRALRFKDYRRYMRLSYALYMLATVLGAIVYVVVFIIGI